MARDAGHRVLYLDFDVHHGDGVQALFWDDPQVVTLSIHETGETLFPGTGFVRERGGHGSDGPAVSIPSAIGTAVNLPMVAGTGDASWLAALQAVVPALAEAFRPTMLVTQHGCDSHLLDPLAHLRLTTAAYREADAAVRRDRPSLVRRPLAGHGRRRLRRLSGRAAILEPRLAGAGAPRTTRVDAARLARSLVRGR